ncbi:MAG TPA: response regulator transcription factor [Candidatus Acidoferrales bacterium]|nr:response regulator transcription factor [Candidatus Acidoferrales bacterium]
MIRICIADDQALVRSGIAALLNLFDGLSVVGEAEDGERAIDVVRSCSPDVLLLDVRMPKMNGIEVLRALSSEGRLPPTLLLTTFEDDAALVAGIKAGARGYLLKGVRPEVLVEAIQTVARGETYLYASLAADRAAADVVEELPLGVLTQREKEVLALLASGISNREIAQALRLSEGTVRNHASNIYSKLGVNGRTKAVLQALQRGDL